MIFLLAIGQVTLFCGKVLQRAQKRVRKPVGIEVILENLVVGKSNGSPAGRVEQDSGKMMDLFCYFAWITRCSVGSQKKQTIRPIKMLSDFTV